MAASELPVDSSIDVLFVLQPDSLALDWAGPAEALRLANQALMAANRPPRFQLHFLGTQAQAASSVGCTISGLKPLPVPLLANPLRPTWVVLLGQPGDCIAVTSAPTLALLHWLRGLRLVSQQLELVTICAGALLAAHAGLLKGRRVTTHHQHLGELAAAEAQCEVISNRVFVQDGPVHSSAGVTTGIDLMIHRIALLCGPTIAARVAQTMVVALRRGPQDAELSPFLSYRNHLHPALHRVQDAISSEPASDWPVPRMASLACTSPRHLTRLFMDNTGVAPLEYLRRIRLATAQAALQSGSNVSVAAEKAGFASDTQLRRAWRQFAIPGTPSSARALL